MNVAKISVLILFTIGLINSNISLSQQVPDEKIQEWLSLIKGRELGPELKSLYIFAHDGKSGVIDTSGNVIVPFKYDFIDGFYNGIAAVNIGGEYQSNSYPQIKGGKWGLVDSTGKFMTDIVYDQIDHSGVFYDLIPVKKEGKLGLIDHSGKNISPFKYDQVEYKVDDDVWLVSIEDSIFINPEGLEQYPDYYYYRKQGLVDEGGEITPIKYNTIYFPFYEGKTRVSVAKYSDELGTHDQYGLINRKGKQIIKPEYDYLDFEIVDVNHVYYFDGLVMLRKDHKYGFANEKGKIVIPFNYDKATRFEDGRSSVSIYEKDETGVVTDSDDFQIDTKGRRIK